MRISVLGIGYVGAVSAVCLARDGHSVVAIDSNPAKVDLINDGRSPIVENGLGEVLADVVEAGRLSGTMDIAAAVLGSDLSFVCVGTPSQPNGSLDLAHVRRVCEQIGAALRQKNDFHTVVFRSTMLPGTVRRVVIPILEQHSGKQAGSDFGVCFNPEFLREGSAMDDFDHPPKTVIGEIDARSGDILAAIYSELDAPLIRTSLEVAEMGKYVDNTWHALKVSFANEIGNLCKVHTVDSHTVMDIFCQDTKLNISTYYLKPGFAFGGSCLPKDVRALNYSARSLDLDLPVLNAILSSNRQQVQRGVELIRAFGKKKIGLLGLAFKAGTDDLRESPLVEVAEALIGKGYDVRIYDASVNLAALGGANKDYLLFHIPHIGKLLVEELQDVLDFADVLVVGNNAGEFKDVLSRARTDQAVVDLVRVAASRASGELYAGFCW